MKNRRFSGAAAIAVSVVPSRAFWIGVGFMVASLVVQAGLVRVLYSLGGQELASNDAVWVILTACSTVLLPLGAALTVLSFIGRALEVVPAGVADPDRPAWPRALAPGTAFWSGCVLLLVGLLLRMLLPEWQMATMAPTDSLLPYVLAYVVDPLAVVFVPVGILLIPAAWVLSMIEASRAAAARVD